MYRRDEEDNLRGEGDVIQGVNHLHSNRYSAALIFVHYRGVSILYKNDY